MSKKKKLPTITKKGKHPSHETSSINKREIQRIARMVFDANEGHVMSYKQVCHAFGKTTMGQKRMIYQALSEMAQLGELQELEPGRFTRGSSEGNMLEGRFDCRAGRPSFIPEDAELDPISLSDRSCTHALHGDRVRLAFRRTRKGEIKAARIIEILERREAVYVGTLQKSRGYSFFVTNNKELRQDVFIPDDKCLGATSRDKVVVRILDWDARAKNPRGEVIDVLGKSGENSTEMHAILAEFGLPYKYPEEVERAAEELSGEITSEELAQREDFRGVLTCTIDPRDAKDFDDALSFRPLSGNRYEVGVHIADVSHYVQPGGIIDDEAYRRATSVYLVDRTIPMLTERLSNFLCSLRPDEDKYAYSCIFTLDAEAQLVSARIARTVIRSTRRFSYEEAQEIIDTGQGDHAEAILTLHQLAQKLRVRRFEKGSIAFDRPEVRFELDKDGKPIAVHIKESKPAHQLIEEFMLLANRTVAERISDASRQDITPALHLKKRTPPTFVYRIHEAPDEEKLRSLSEFVARMGYKLRTEGGAEAVTQSLNKLLNDIKGKPEENMISMLAIRSMAKARYTTAHIGHYGLGFESYTHFTSPIRRYPDLMVHRLLTRYLIEGKESADVSSTEEQCDHASDMESVAANAERSSIKYKQVEYMIPRLGQTFTGVITGLADWGIYVELDENKCEGLVPARDLEDDYYEYDETSFSLVGRHTGRRFRLGDQLEVTVAQADLARRQLDFALAESSKPRSSRRRR
nr:ribonuclease R [uncultured Porphyromonas sp.]